MTCRRCGGLCRWDWMLSGFNCWQCARVYYDSIASPVLEVGRGGNRLGIHVDRLQAQAITETQFNARRQNGRKAVREKAKKEGPPRRSVGGLFF